MDWEKMIPVWQTLAGALAAIGASAVTAYSTSKRETQARLEQRRSLVEERRAKFQRETLLALQDHLASLMRAAARAYLHDVQAHQNGAAWLKTFLPSEIDEALREGQAKTSLLSERSIDANVRNAVQQAKGIVSSIAIALDPETARNLLNMATSASEQAQKCIGAALRDLDKA